MRLRPRAGVTHNRFPSAGRPDHPRGYWVSVKKMVVSTGGQTVDTRSLLSATAPLPAFRRVNSPSPALFPIRRRLAFHRVQCTSSYTSPAQEAPGEAQSGSFAAFARFAVGVNLLSLRMMPPSPHGLLCRKNGTATSYSRHVPGPSVRRPLPIMSPPAPPGGGSCCCSDHVFQPERVHACSSLGINRQRHAARRGPSEQCFGSPDQRKSRRRHPAASRLNRRVLYRHFMHPKLLKPLRPHPCYRLIPFVRAAATPADRSFSPQFAARGWPS